MTTVRPFDFTMYPYKRYRNGKCYLNLFPTDCDRELVGRKLGYYPRLSVVVVELIAYLDFGERIYNVRRVGPALYHVDRSTTIKFGEMLRDYLFTSDAVGAELPCGYCYLQWFIDAGLSQRVIVANAVSLGAYPKFLDVVRALVSVVSDPSVLFHEFHVVTGDLLHIRYGANKSTLMSILTRNYPVLRRNPFMGGSVYFDPSTEGGNNIMATVCAANGISIEDVVAGALRAQAADPNSEVSKMAMTAYMSNVARTHRDGPRNRAGNITIYQQLTDTERAKLTESFPELSIKFQENCVVHGHGYAAASRKCETELLQVLCGVTNPAVRVRSGYDVPVIDVGGDPHYNLCRNRLHIHHCAPILDARDSIRRQSFLASLSTGIRDGGKFAAARKRLADQKNLAAFICTRLSQKCTLRAEKCMFVHSIYDMTNLDIANIMAAHLSNIAYGSVIFTPEILVNETGFIPVLGCHWSRYTTKLFEERITFCFDKDPSIQYDHSFKKYREFFVNTALRSSSGSVYITEFLNIRNGICFFKITKHSYRTAGMKITHNFWLSGMCDKYVVTFYNFDHMQPCLKSLRYRKHVFTVPKVLYDKAERFAMTLHGQKFNIPAIYEYARSVNYGFSADGKDIIKTHEPVLASDMYEMSAVIYINVYAKRFSIDCATSEIIKQINTDRNTSFFGKLWVALYKTVIGAVVFPLFVGGESSVACRIQATLIWWYSAFRYFNVSVIAANSRLEYDSYIRSVNVDDDFYGDLRMMVDSDDIPNIVDSFDEDTVGVVEQTKRIFSGMLDVFSGGNTTSVGDNASQQTDKKDGTIDTAGETLIDDTDKKQNDKTGTIDTAGETLIDDTDKKQTDIEGVTTVRRAFGGNSAVDFVVNENDELELETYGLRDCVCSDDFHVIAVPGDGNCYYHCVEIHLNVTVDEQHFAIALNEHRYCQSALKLINNNMFAEISTLAAIGVLYGVTTCVHDGANACYRVVSETESSVMHVRLIGQHYEYLRPHNAEVDGGDLPVVGGFADVPGVGLRRTTCALDELNGAATEIHTCLRDNVGIVVANAALKLSEDTVAFVRDFCNVVNSPCMRNAVVQKIFDIARRSRTRVEKARFSYDPYSRITELAVYPNRTAYKLVEIISVFSIILDSKSVLDLGGSPGGFAAVCLAAGASHVKSISIEDHYVKSLSSDSRFEKVIADIRDVDVSGNYDIVLADTAVETSYLDEELSIVAVNIAAAALSDRGIFIVKHNNISAISSNFKRMMSSNFHNIFQYKPLASRCANTECYFIATHGASTELEFPTIDFTAYDDSLSLYVDNYVEPVDRNMSVDDMRTIFSRFEIDPFADINDGGTVRRDMLSADMQFDVAYRIRLDQQIHGAENRVYIQGMHYVYNYRLENFAYFSQKIMKMGADMIVMIVEQVTENFTKLEKGAFAQLEAHLMCVIAPVVITGFSVFLYCGCSDYVRVAIHSVYNCDVIAEVVQLFVHRLIIRSLNIPLDSIDGNTFSIASYDIESVFRELFNDVDLSGETLSLTRDNVNSKLHKTKYLSSDKTIANLLSDLKFSMTRTLGVTKIAVAVNSISGRVGEAVNYYNGGVNPLKNVPSRDDLLVANATRKMMKKKCDDRVGTGCARNVVLDTIKQCDVVRARSAVVDVDRVAIDGHAVTAVISEFTPYLSVSDDLQLPLTGASIIFYDPSLSYTDNFSRYKFPSAVADAFSTADNRYVSGRLSHALFSAVPNTDGGIMIFLYARQNDINAKFANLLTLLEIVFARASVFHFLDYTSMYSSLYSHMESAIGGAYQAVAKHRYVVHIDAKSKSFSHMKKYSEKFNKRSNDVVKKLAPNVFSVCDPRYRPTSAELFNPQYLSGNDALSCMKNAMIEQRELWRVKTHIVRCDLKKFYHSINGVISTSTRALIADSADEYCVFDSEYNVVVKAAGVSSEYEYVFDGVELVKFGDKGRRGNKIANSATRLMQDAKLYDATEGVNITSFTGVNINFVEGVPGCGKTYRLCKTVRRPAGDKPGDIAVFPSRFAAEDFRKRMMSRYPDMTEKICRDHYMTMDSLLMNYRGQKCSILYVDEALMVHIGQVLLCAAIVGAGTIDMIGDRKQIPYINRTPQCGVRYSSPLLFTEPSSVLDVSYRCTLSTSMILSSLYLDVGHGMSSVGDVYREMEIVRYTNVSALPRHENCQYLVFKQSEKCDLVRGLRGGESGASVAVNTIHEFQGKEADTIILVRTTPKPHEIYERDEHCLVAVSRHRRRFIYVTAKMDDKISKWIAKTTCVSRAEIAKYRALTGGGVVMREKKPIVDMPECFSKLINIVGADHERVTCSYVPEKTEYDYLPVMKCAKLQCTNVQPCKSVLQDFYDQCLPGNSTFPMRHISDMIQYETTLNFEYERTKFNPELGHPVPSKFSKLRPEIRTAIGTRRLRSLREMLLAAVKRNQNIPNMAGLADNNLLAAMMRDSFVGTFLDSSAQMQIRRMSSIGVNSADLMDWLNGQSSGALPQITYDRPLSQMRMDQYNFSIKATAKPDLTTAATDSYAALQTIAAHPKNINAIFCPIFREMSNRLTIMMSNKFKIFSNMTNGEFSKHFSSASMMYGIKPDDKFLEIDIGKYDKSQGELALSFECMMMEFFGVDPHLIFLWRRAHEYGTLVDHVTKVKMYVRYQRKSGDASTFFGNTMFLMGIMSMLYNLKTCKFAAFSGDDSFLVGGEIDEDLNELCAGLFNLESKFFRNYSVKYFCSKFVLNVGPDVFFVPDPLKLVAKLGRCDLSNFDHVEEYRISLCDLLVDYSNVLIHDELSRAVCDRYGVTGDFSYLFKTIVAFVGDPEAFRSLWFSESWEILCLNCNYNKKF